MRSFILFLIALSSTLFAEKQFTRISLEDSGFDFLNPLLVDHPQGYLYDSPFGCGGVAVGDVNADGFVDLFFTNGPTPNALYLNQGQFKFKKANFPEADNPWSAGATFVDIDIDGDQDLDLYVCNYDAPNHLWLNDGHGQFTEVAAEYGLALEGPSLMASFCDYDRDGDLDIFLQNHRLYYPEKHYPKDLKYARSIQIRPPIANGLKPKASKMNSVTGVLMATKISF